MVPQPEQVAALRGGGQQSARVPRVPQTRRVVQLMQRAAQLQHAWEER